MREPTHTYPSRHPRGSSWEGDEAWDILDCLAPGAIPDEVRAFLAGMISGTLRRVAQNPQAAINEWRRQHGGVTKDEQA